MAHTTGLATSQNRTNARCMAWILAASLGCGGCGLTEGPRGGDPLLGNIPRPIAPTPMVGSEGGTIGNGGNDEIAALGRPTFISTGTTGSGPFSPIGTDGNPSQPPPAAAAPGDSAPPDSGGQNSPPPATATRMPSLNFPRNQSASTTPAAMAAGGYPQANSSGLRIPASARKPMGATLPPYPANGSRDEVADASAPPWMELAKSSGSAGAATPPPEARQPLMTVGGLSDVPVSGQTTPPATAPKFQSVDEAQAHLKKQGALYQKLEQAGNGDWQFSCVLPNEQNILVNRRYEARDPDKLHAVQLVVDQIYRDRGK
ncbi:hypothetical protein [Tuwongella immobilis]|uniref:Uncharacterized protein n=1 Tax=Tuwongella immobilis TaxID=692036 RepID=A0A6C2YY28_9BACT|nr:hypothetical protein [Tuwongella immobilis]VIP05692.1 unnamed protein product [Tuwongella immobilis]VTS08740.1 unnamed protein product [Tuwongella immobilis]